MCSAFINGMQETDAAQGINANIKIIEQSTQALTQLLVKQNAQNKKIDAEVDKKRKELEQKQAQLKETRKQLAAAQKQRADALAKINLKNEKGILLQAFNARYDILVKLNKLNSSDESEINKIVGELLAFYSGPQLEFFKAFLTKIGKTELLQ